MRQAPSGEGQPSKASGSAYNPIIAIRQLPLFGERTRRRVQYFFTAAITGSSSALFSYVCSANGAYDPDISGGGHQPMGFDQMMGMFNHYTVIGSRMRAIFTSASTFPVHFGTMISGSSSYSTDYQVNTENGNMIYGIATAGTTSGCCITLKQSVNCAKFQGIDDVLDDPNMRGDASSNPSEQMYYHLMVWNPASSSIPTGTLDVYLEFDTMFHEPRKGVLSITSKTVDARAPRPSDVVVIEKKSCSCS